MRSAIRSGKTASVALAVALPRGGKAVTLLKALVAASALAELRSVEREHAARLLVELATRA
jgi:hypothetical protein